ncbi:TPA: YkgJ family cysteine cluster protein [Methanosarcinaceae archaeon]|nr:YkgJ family cysteine cluster protein [Methanosarcinaceae archaeon]
MIFEKVPINMFDDFHNIFSGSNGKTFNICRECEGACEHNKIGTLLPGEKDYMASRLGISVREFEDLYLDILEMNDGTRIDVLKLGRLCPFLNRKTFECECREFKPILCKIYPVVFKVEGEGVNFIIDSWCQLSKKKECRNYFKNAIPLFSALPVPAEWFRYVVSYDDLCFDYDQLKTHRKGKKPCEVFYLQELLDLLKDESGAESLQICFETETEKFMA